MISEARLRELATETFLKIDRIYAAVNQQEAIYQAFLIVVAESGGEKETTAPEREGCEHSPGWWMGLKCTRCGNAG